MNRERGRGRASRGKCQLLHTPLGVARTGAFQAFSVKPPAMPGDIDCLGYHGKEGRVLDTRREKDLLLVRLPKGGLSIPERQ